MDEFSMTARTVLLILLGGLFFVAEAHAAVSFFGIEIGAPFSVRACVADDFATFNRPLEVCVSARQDSQSPWGAITHIVKLVDSVDTRGISELVVTEYKNAVIGIGAVTTGETSQKQVLGDLTEKFGQPSKSSKSVVQNAFGAKFEAIHASWVKAEYTVKFDGMIGSRDTGQITVNSVDAIASEERAAADSWRIQASKGGAKM